MQLGKFLQQRLGPGLGCQDAAHGGQGEGAEADGAFQRPQHIVTLVMGQERQELLRLQLGIGLLVQEAVEELHRDGPQFVEALPQELFAFAWIVGRMMALERLPHTALRAADVAVPSNLLQAE